MNRTLSTTEKRICRIALLAVLGLQIKYIFMAFDADTAYALSTSWRMLLGDKMFVDMWEPHQTSSFLLTAIMWLYTRLVGSNTGIVLFANAMGVLIHAGVIFLFYRVFRDHLDTFLLSLMCFFLLIVRPKQYVLPDFSNMQLWFSILLFLCLFEYFQRQENRLWLFLASISLCLQVLSYPSCLLVYLGVCVILLLYSHHKGRALGFFTLCCFLQGLAYVLFFVLRIGVTPFLQNLSAILAGDSAHSLTSLSGIFWISLTQAGLWLSVCFLLGLFLSVGITVYHRQAGKNSSRSTFLYRTVFWFSAIAMGTGTMNLVRFRITYPYSWLWFTAVYLFLFFLAAAGLRYCSPQEKKLLVMGYILSLCSFLAVLLLTNLDFLCILNYTPLAVALCFVPISHLLRRHSPQTVYWKKYTLLILFCLTMALQNGLDIINARGIVTSGPVMGFVSDYIKTYDINQSMEEWEEYVHPGDNLLIIGSSPLNPIGYMYGDTHVSIHSVMCDPTYNETLLDYWEKHPEKYPDVVVVQSWYGDIRPEEDSWAMQWLHKEFRPHDYVDGCFWRYYR